MITIAIGANLDIQNVSSKYETCLQALNILQKDYNCKIIKTSDWYQTTAWPDASKPPYVNAVAIVSPKAENPHVFLSELHEIEAKLGRIRNERWASRTLDLDLLTWNDCVTDNQDSLQGLALPHPRLCLRYFVLVPLVQIAPKLIIPSIRKSVQEIYNELVYNKKDIRFFKKATI